MSAARRWWLITLAWCLGVIAAIAGVLLVSHAKGGILAARPAARLEVRASPRAQVVDLAPLRAEIAACRDEVAQVRWQLEALLPTAWPDRERAPMIPRGAKPPAPRATFPAAGSARRWKRGGW